MSYIDNEEIEFKASELKIPNDYVRNVHPSKEFSSSNYFTGITSYSNETKIKEIDVIGSKLGKS